jgi:hypothetical protein
MRYLNHLLAVVMTACLALVGCSDDDGGNNLNNINNNNPTDDTIYQLQDESHESFIPEDGTVDLQNVVVTAIDNFGDYTGSIFVEEPSGGEFSGVIVFVPQFTGTTIDDLMVGDMVNVTGIKDEFVPSSGDRTGRSKTEIVDGTVEFVAQGQPLEPDVVPSAQLIMTDPGGEAYEGVLVAVENVRAEEVNQYGEVVFSGGLVVGGDLMDAATEAEIGTCYGEVVGVLDYFYKYVLHPRSSADFVVAANDSDCDVAGETVCDDGTDNDGDGFTDCEDFDCQGDPACSEQDCADGVDNDGDGFTDCDDFDCDGDPACMETVCDDGTDNDGDGYTDCGDNDCKGSGDCAENTPALCEDGLDNNGNGLTDCDDPACQYQPEVLAAGTCASLETGAAECSDATDNDNDSFVDCGDFSCTLNPDVVHGVCEDEIEDTEAECSDGVDNDGDEYTDCDDFSCQYAGVCPDVEATDAQCSDGDDNDGDGYVDCLDWSCQDSSVVTVCEGNIVTCSDDLDNDGNGYVDCQDNSCRYCDCDTQTFNVVKTCPPCECP